MEAETLSVQLIGTPVWNVQDVVICDDLANDSPTELLRPVGTVIFCAIVACTIATCASVSMTCQIYLNHCYQADQVVVTVKPSMEFFKSCSDLFAQSTFGDSDGVPTNVMSTCFVL